VRVLECTGDRGCCYPSQILCFLVCKVWDVDDCYLSGESVELLSELSWNCLYVTFGDKGER
ncbi:MAG: hypothetical protein EZS28_050900, partial [Streblomastix strix]